MKRNFLKSSFFILFLIGCLCTSCQPRKIMPPPPPIDQFATVYLWQISRQVDTLRYGNFFAEKAKPNISVYIPDTINNYVLIEKYDTVYLKPDLVASFVGGSDSLKKFIDRNQGIKANALVSIFVSFIVDKYGKIGKIGFLHKMAGYPYEKSLVLEILNKMPNWIPAKVNDKNVASFVKLKVILNDE